MALAARVKAVPHVSTTGIPCSVGNALQHLPPGERETFAELLGTPEQRGEVASYIYELMRAERDDILDQAEEANDADRARLLALAKVYDVKYQQINKHRGNRCRCVKASA